MLFDLLKLNSSPKLAKIAFKCDQPCESNYVVSKPPVKTLPSISQSTVFYLQKSFSSNILDTDFRIGTFVKGTSQKFLNWLLDWFFSQIENKFRQNYTLRFISQCLSRCFNFIMYCYSTVKCCVLFFGMGIWNIDFVHKCLVLRIIPINKLNFFQNTGYLHSGYQLTNFRFVKHSSMITFL